MNNSSPARRWINYAKNQQGNMGYKCNSKLNKAVVGGEYFFIRR